MTDSLFSVGNEVESITDVGPLVNGDTGVIDHITNGGNLIVTWDGGIQGQFTVYPNEIIHATPL